MIKGGSLKIEVAANGGFVADPTSEYASPFVFTTLDDMLAFLKFHFADAHEQAPDGTIKPARQT